MRQVSGIALVVAASIGFAAGVLSQGKTDPVLNKLAAQFAAAYNAKDAQKLAALYADDAVVMPPNQPMVKGRAGIQAMLERDLKTAGKLQLTPIESGISGNMAFEAGAAIVTTPAGATENDKYLTVFKRVGSDWKIAYDIYNADKPPAK